ncbi:Leucine-rich repeat-containing protein 4B [Lucilia cuprina]|nr:Leucine-rich repeat-containing protein 4B [Lucilia cuprina]
MLNSWQLMIVIPLGCLWNSCMIETSKPCPLECICLSQTQVLCNTGGLNHIPLRHLPTNVEHLSLTKNHFHVIKPDSFAGLRALKKLSLDGNNITKIKQFAFRGLPRLKELSIQYTPLQVVTSFAFAGLQNLSTILLSHNQIATIEAYAFAGTSNVKLILLTNNPLLRIESFAFSSLTQVGHLLLPAGIRTVESDAFSGMYTVGLLKLAYMDLEHIRPYTFRGLSNVLLLTIQESDLGVISSEAFAGLTQVDTLQLLNNKIDIIEALDFNETSAIKYLKLHGNHFLQTPEPDAICLDGVDNLELNDNYFPCGCHLQNLLDSAFVSKTPNSTQKLLERNYCISPIELNGRLIAEVNIETMAPCQEHLMQGNLGSTANNLKLHYLCFIGIFLWLKCLPATTLL